MKYFFKLSLTLLLVAFSTVKSNAQEQYGLTVNSSLNYDVTIVLSTTNIVAPNSCQWGYNFNVGLDYEIYFVGPDAPANLYTLQGNMGCGTITNNNFFDLPNSGGIGSEVTTGNPWNPNSDCFTATPSTLECNALTIEIEGPGIAHQFISMPSLAVLPVSLISFEIENKGKNQIDLKWVTASEENNAYFTVEHSLDGIAWDSVSSVKGAGNTKELTSYSITDYRATNGLNYYRLKQTDFNGDFQYSPIRLVKLNNLEEISSISISPNPALDNISIKGSPSDLTKVEIFNAQGVSVKVLENKENTASSISLDISTLQNGVYFVKSMNNIQKLVVGPKG